MLTCPHCGVRISGEDLVAGVCSKCSRKLTGSGDSSLVDATMISDEFVSADEGLPPSDPSTVGDISGDDRSVGKGTIVVSLSTPGLNPDDQPTADDVEAASATQQTFISDEFFDNASGTADSLDDAATIAKTFVTDESIDVSSGDPQAQFATLQDSSLVSDSADDSIAKTFVSDEANDLQKTIQSHWGDEDEGAIQTQMTMRGREVDRLKSPKSTLVIKERQFRNLPTQPSSMGDDPEYELLKVLGEGGMGVVYTARQTSIDRDVAVKMLKADTASNEKQRQKFVAEAVVTGDLDHPNIVPIYDVGRNDQGFLFYSMKRVEGTPWSDAIAEKSLVENLEILMKVADAIAFAHARGVVHRDLKPENIMLGSFGEVLVMDWGLALLLPAFRKRGTLADTTSMGGTPAYMAPEMATGPLDKISIASDVYLLGAILFEILTGRPPHTGKTAMKCLMAAARNEIIPTEVSGELMEIARRAMATNPAERPATVPAFQAAIRDYQSHSESVFLSSRAVEDLNAARSSDNYQDFARALFGFEEAAELWSGNRSAAAGAIETRLAYAQSALAKGDYDLGLSITTDDEPTHTDVRRELRAAQAERDARQQRLQAQRRMLRVAAALFLFVVSTAAVLIYIEKGKAEAAEKIAVKERDNAVEQEKIAVRERKVADEQRGIAVAEEKKARAAETEALTQKAEAERQQMIAVNERNEAERQRLAADAARQAAELAKQAEEYEAYIARIGLASAKISENSFDAAREVLAGCKPELRRWEWGRLEYLCSRSQRSFTAAGPLDALAINEHANLVAAGGWDGKAVVWNRETGQVVREVTPGGNYVFSVALSPDGESLLTGSDLRSGGLQLYSMATGEKVREFDGHEDAITAVSFSRDGSKILSASYDGTARLWETATGHQIASFRGHTWWVWSARFSSDESEIVTASQDGTVRVWKVANASHGPPFTGHQGPVYAATFSPDGKTIASAGYDRRILAWHPADLRPIDYQSLTEAGTASVRQMVPSRGFIGHSGSVRDLDFAPDGQTLLSASQDNTVKLWRVDSGELMTTLRGHGGWVRSARFIHGGHGVASASHDRTVREWSLAGREEFQVFAGQVLDGHTDGILSASFSPDRTHIVTASRDHTARIWDASTGGEVMRLSEGHAYLASSAILFDEGRRLMTAAVDNSARIWDVASGAELLRLEKTGRAAAVAVSPDQETIVTGGAGGIIQVWNARTGERTRVVSAERGHTQEVTALAFADEGRSLLSGDARGRLCVWDFGSGQLKHRFDSHTRKINQIVVFPDGKTAATASSDNTVGQWDLAAGTELKSRILKHPDAVLAIQLTADGSTIITSCADQRLRVWNAETADARSVWAPFAEQVYSFDLSPDGQRLLTCYGNERTVRQWELATGRELVSATTGGPLVDLRRVNGLLWSAMYLPDGADILTVGGSDARIWEIRTGRERMTFSPHSVVAAASFSPAGDLVATASWDNSAKIWNVETGKVKFKLEGGHDAAINTVAFSPDGSRIATGGDDGQVIFWSAADGKELDRLTHPGRVRHLQYSRDGKWLATGCQDAIARLIDVASRSVIREFRGHEWAILSVAFSDDGTALATASDDKTARVWNVATGEVRQVLEGHSAAVTSVCFSPKGDRLLTGSSDESARVWDPATGKEVLALALHARDVTSVAFSGDGRLVLTGSRDGTAVVWPSSDWQANPVGNTEKVVEESSINRR